MSNDISYFDFQSSKNKLISQSKFVFVILILRFANPLDIIDKSLFNFLSKWLAFPLIFGFDISTACLKKSCIVSTAV